MRRVLPLAAGLCFVGSIVGAQPPPDLAAKPDLLSMEQQIEVAQLITKEATPLTSGAYSIQMDGIVPAEVQVHSLPAEAERLAPRLRGFGYIVVEEQIAIIDPRTRKVELVFPRWGK
jgi:uncharacterized protein DUF1236